MFPFTLRSGGRRHGAGARAATRFACEPLEGRMLLSVTTFGIPDWLPQGPLIVGGQVDNIPGIDPVTGAIAAVAPHPTNPSVLYVGAVNGGIWKTIDAYAERPTWTALIDQYPSLSIGALEFDRTDEMNQTLVAGIGRYSVFPTGGPQTGLLRTTDGGGTWTQLGQTDLAERSISAVGPRGNTILAAVDSGTNPGLYRSNDGGTTFTPVSGSDGSSDSVDNDGDGMRDEPGELNLPVGRAFDLASDPNHPNRFYVAVSGNNGGIFRTDDVFGNKWIALTANIADPTTAFLQKLMRTQGKTGGAERVRLSVSQAAPNPLYVGIVVGQNLEGVFRSENLGGTWAQMDVPQLPEGPAPDIVDATNATPIVITTATDAPFQEGNRVLVTGVKGNTAANGIFRVKKINARQFQLTDFQFEPTSGSGKYVAPGPSDPRDTIQALEGLHASQGGVHFSLVADPANPFIVYVGGETHILAPNSVGASRFTGRLFRGDARIPSAIPTQQWLPLTHNGTLSLSAPHADSRDMAFDASGNLIQGDDGGVYRRTTPRLAGRITSAVNTAIVTGPIIIFSDSHGLATGERVRITGMKGNTAANDKTFTVTVITANAFLLNGSNGNGIHVRGTGAWGTGDWFSVIGDLSVTEMYDLSYSHVSHTFLGGAQDTGTPRQLFRDSPLARDLGGGDGPRTDVDDFTLAGGNQYIAYGTFGRQEPERQVFASNNDLVRRETLVPQRLLGTPADRQRFQVVAVNAIAPTREQLDLGQSTRVVIGGKNAIYEATNAGVAAAGLANDTNKIDWTQIQTPGNVPVPVNWNAIVYGGRRLGVNQPRVLYVGSSIQTAPNTLSPRVFVRTDTDTLLRPMPIRDDKGTDLAGVGRIDDIVLDSNDWRTAYAIDNDQIFRTTDAGVSWADITGNLRALMGNIDPNLRTIEFIAGAGASAGFNAVLVGGVRGVFRMPTHSPGDWAEFGDRLPNTIAFDLDYDATDNVLAVGTLGRGAWKVPNVRDTVFSGAGLRVDGDTDFANEGDVIQLVRDPKNPLMLNVFLNRFTTEQPNKTLPLAAINRIEINGLGGDDLLFVNDSNGPISLARAAAPGILVFNGGAGNDSVGLAASADTLADINGGTGGDDRLHFEGQGFNYSLTSTIFTSASRREVFYSGMETLGLAHGTFTVGDLPSGLAVDVNDGATLEGHHLFTGLMGALTVNAGGTVSPSGLGTPGIFKAGDTTFNRGSQLVLDLNGAPETSHDLLRVTGSVNLNGASIAATLLRYTPQPGDVLVIIRNDENDSVTGIFEGLDEGADLNISGKPFRISYRGGEGNNDVVLTAIGVSGFTLISAQTGQPIRELTDGARLDLATLRDVPLNIQAVTTPGRVGSVRFAFAGNANFRTDDLDPYTLFGDEGSTLAVGPQMLTATPFTRSGTPGAARTIRFVVVRTS